MAHAPSWPAPGADAEPQPQPAEDVTSELPQVLLENYLTLAAAIENQNLGRLHDMMQYQQRVHYKLIEMVQHIEDAPAVAMTASARPADAAAPAGAGWRPNGGAPEAAAAPGASLAAAAGGTSGGDGGTLEAAVQQCEQPPPPPQQQQQQHDAGRPSLHAAPPGLQGHGQGQQAHAPHPPPAPAWVASINQPVATLFEGLGLSQFVPLLEAASVDMAALQLMDEQHLRELGLPLGAIVKIAAALDGGRAAGGAAPAR